MVTSILEDGHKAPIVLLEEAHLGCRKVVPTFLDFEP